MKLSDEQFNKLADLFAEYHETGSERKEQDIKEEVTVFIEGIVLSRIIAFADRVIARTKTDSDHD